MARKGVTATEVERAMGKLEFEGKAATMVAIRAEIGGGSMSTISRHVKAIREEKAETHPQVQVEMPEALKAMSNDLVVAFWNKATEVASADVEEIRKTAKSQVSEMDKELREAYEAIDALDQELAQCQEELDRTTFEIKRLSEENIRAEASLAELRGLHKEATTRFEAYLKQLEGKVNKEQPKSDADD